MNLLHSLIRGKYAENTSTDTVKSLMLQGFLRKNGKIKKELYDENDLKPKKSTFSDSPYLEQAHQFRLFLDVEDMANIKA